MEKTQQRKESSSYTAVSMNLLKAIWKDKDLRKKCLITLLILTVCKLLSSIPTPGVNPDYFKLMMQNNSALGFLNSLTGNGLSRLSIATLSISPFITASIIFQLLCVIFPKLQEIQKGHEKHQERKREAILLLTGVAMSLLQSITMSIGFGRTGLLLNYKWYVILGVSLTWTLTSTFIYALGLVITKKFIGSGMSLILLMNILSSYPSDAFSVWVVLLKGKDFAVFAVTLIAIIAVIVALFIFTILLQECEKRIVVNYSGKLSQKGSSKATNIIPLKLCPGGVVPIIFASSLITFPVMIFGAFGKTDSHIIRLLNPNQWFNANYPIYTLGALLYCLLIFGFAYFYTEITFNPIEVANNIQKAGGTISGIRPGKSTAEYLRSQMKYMIAIGAIALCFIALLPMVISGTLGLNNLSFLGTSIIITVGVILETKKLLETKTHGSIYMNRINKGGLFRA